MYMLAYIHKPPLMYESTEDGARGTGQPPL